MIYQPKGAGTTVKNGTVLVGAPAGAKGSAITDEKYRIDTYASPLPSTGTINDKYDERFDDHTYYTA